MEKKKGFDFTSPKTKLNRNDNLELREKILNMTVEERKEIGNQQIYIMVHEKEHCTKKENKHL